MQRRPILSLLVLLIGVLWPAAARASGYTTAESITIILWVAIQPWLILLSLVALLFGWRLGARQGHQRVLLFGSVINFVVGAWFAYYLIANRSGKSVSDAALMALVPLLNWALAGAGIWLVRRERHRNAESTT